MLIFDKATFLSLLFRFILSVGLSNSFCRSDVLLFSQFTNFVPIKFCILLISLYCHTLF